MVSIVTVHGTFDHDDSDSGERWWQKDSQFQNEVLKRLDLESGQHDWVPFHWSGANSEIDRRRGGKALYEFLRDRFEKDNKPYHLVGHSHGGSVIAEALRGSVQARQNLENLRSWITVGTPFLSFKKQKGIFIKLSRPYQLLLTILFAYLLAVILAVPIGMCEDSPEVIGGCWVEKSDSRYFDFANISTVSPALTDEELTYHKSLGTVVERPLSGLSTINGDRGERYPTRAGTDYYNLINLDFEPPSAQSEPVYSLDLKFATLDDNLYSRDGVILTTEAEALAAQMGELTGQDSEELAAAFRALNDVPHSRDGVFALDVCSQSNWMFFGLNDPKYRTGQLPDGTPVQSVDSKIYNKTIYKDDLELLQRQCRDMRYGDSTVISGGAGVVVQEPLKSLPESTAQWAQTTGFKEPKTLTFYAGYTDGKERLIELEFENQDQLKLTPMIPRLEALLSPGILIYLFFALLPALLAGAFLWRSQKYLRKRYRNIRTENFRRWYHPKWIKLSHPEDEAINSISAATQLALDVGPPDMLKGIFMLGLSTLAALGLIFGGAEAIGAILGEDAWGFDEELIEELGYALNIAHDFSNGTQSFSDSNLGVFLNDDGGLGIVSLLILFGAILLAVIMLGRLIERLILNPFLKSQIDNIAQASAIREGFGDDIIGEIPTKCAACPQEIEADTFNAFPDALKEAIEKRANKNLVALPGKFRSVLHDKVSNAQKFSMEELLEGEMDEFLIHTAYFNVPEFQDMFSAVLVRSGDFIPTAGFKNHETAGAWADEILGQVRLKIDPEG